MKKQKWNQGWRFEYGGSSAFATFFGGTPEVVDVTIPHDASVIRERNPEEPNGSGNGFFREENYTYTKEFILAEADREKEVMIEFEGVYQNAFVYINHAFAGKHPYGYGNFYIDATPYVKFGEKNEIKVVVKNGVPSGRWYTGGGIYRDVNLIVGDRLHLVPDQVHVSAPEIEKDLASIQVEAAISYHGTGVRDIVLRTVITDENGGTAAEESTKITILENTEQKYLQRLCVADPELWDMDRPCLYHYHTEILENNMVIDEEDGTFGIRKLQLDPVHGLRINGKEVKLRGGCIHHDNGVTGSAEFAHAAEFRVKRLKEAGYNAIRSSHYPMSRHLLDACDRLGMVVMDEFADVWTSTKVDFDYGMHMAEWWDYDVKKLVDKDFNHPCVIMYSIGNEIPETGNKFDVQWGKKLADRFRELDHTRYVTNSLNLMLSAMDRLGELMPEILRENGIEVPEGQADGTMEINSLMSQLGDMMAMIVASDKVGIIAEESLGQVDIAGYNYAAPRYEKDLETYPNRILVGSETNPADLDYNWELVEKHPRIIGDFSWTAWDYLGEAGIGKISYGEGQQFSFYAPYPYKAGYCGDMNLIGDRRPVSYWREIIWGLREKPYLAVQLPEHYGEKKIMSQWCMTDAVHSWTWRGYEGKHVIVEVYTKAEEAELYRNGTLLERKKVGEIKKDQVLFDIVYEPGTLEAVVYTDGKESGRDILFTASGQSVLHPESDAEVIPADGSDICYVDLSILDENGVLDTDAEMPVTVTIEGPGIIAGYGSADPGSEENYFDSSAKPYEGRLRAAIRGNGEAGSIRVTFGGDGYEEKSVVIEAK